MAQWIEVRARYDKMMENGSVKKVTEPYLADALSCTEAEARVTEELQPFISGGDFRISSVVTTKISEIFWDASGDRFYKVKVNFITLEKFVDACAEGGVESVTMTACDGRTVKSATIEIPQKGNKPKPNDNG